MIPTAGPPHSPPPPRGTARRGPSTVVAAAAALCALLLGLTACGGAAGPSGAAPPQDVASWTHDEPSGARAVDRQADAQRDAVTEAARAAVADSARQAAAERAAAAAAERSGESSGRCTTRPEDRAACTMPEGARITPDGGDIDGDGVFEDDEPVGPGYKDPRAYDGGPTSGEVQCQWAREHGLDC
ncbi:hypothetical protein [Streptomyces sp. TR06-5]|uniref:hypothetical protein n=1 Tax=unclassified Streptomyces TaxID=2593676 RepID=UPI0039A38144